MWIKAIFFERERDIQNNNTAFKCDRSRQYDKILLFIDFLDFKILHKTYFFNFFSFSFLNFSLKNPSKITSFDFRLLDSNEKEKCLQSCSN